MIRAGCLECRAAIEFVVAGEFDARDFRLVTTCRHCGAELALTRNGIGFAQE